MLNNVSRNWLLSGWCVTVAFIVVWSAVVGARLSTSALLLVIGMAPVVIKVLIEGGRPSPTVAEILHSVDAKDGRR